MAKFKIALCFSDTGGGHRTAAEAVSAAIAELSSNDQRGNEYDIITENIIENCHPLNRGFVNLYNHLLRHAQWAMKYYYWAINVFKPNDSNFGYKLCAPYVERFLSSNDPAVVVSVHPMSNQYLARAMRETGLNRTAKLVTVLTDPSGDLWRGWACPEADLTICPNELGQDVLTKWGVDPKKIRKIGMPVNPEFLKPPTTSKEEFRHHIGLYRERLTVCINAGWAGGGNMMSIYHQLEKVERQIQVIFLCGHNRTLYEKARRMARKCSVPTAVLPFHDKMSDLMSAVDLMVTKAGGLTTFEAVAKKLPLALDIITEPMPQEMGTVDLLVDSGLASRIKKPRDIVSIVENLKLVDDRSQVALPAVHCLNNADATFDIARAIMSFCDPYYLPATEHGSASKPLG